MRLRRFSSVLFLLTKGVLPLIDGNALLEEFVESLRYREKDQRFLDIRIKAFIKHGLLGAIVQIQRRDDILEIR